MTRDRQVSLRPIGIVSRLKVALSLLLLVGTFSSLTVSRSAAQMMLYEDRLPDGYAYVRFANVTTGPISLKPDGFADPLNLGTTDGDRISSYYVVENVADRDITVHVGSKQLAFRLKPGSFHTLLLEGKADELSPKVVTDQGELSQTKARLAFYNAVATCTPAGLYLEPKGQAIVADVAPNTMRGRSINPAKSARVRANCGQTVATELDLGAINAGGQYSLWLMAPGGGTPVAFLSQNKIAPFLR